MSASVSLIGNAPAVKPDARHGVIVATGNLRTEDDPRGLQQPSLFVSTPTSSIAVSPDGKRVAVIRSAETGQQIVTFTTAHPNELTTTRDLSGEGQIANHLVWAGDGSDSLLFDATKMVPGPANTMTSEYSALWSIDLGTKEVREVGRVSGQNTKLWPIAWLPKQQIAGALELPQAGAVTSYVLIKPGGLQRAPVAPGLALTAFSSSRNGLRVLVSNATGVRWWPTDQPAAAQDLPAGPRETLGHAEFRPGVDAEIGVEVLSGGRFDIWTLAGPRRVVAERVAGFIHWRVDGTAAITSSDPNTVLLIDPTSGAMTPLPGGGFPVADVVAF